jgi:cytochrome c2
MNRITHMAVAAALLGTAGAAGAQTADQGQKIFARCAICNTVEPGKNRMGPSLAGVVGRKAGTAAGYNYSPAMKAAKLIWNTATLDKYLTNPRAVVPGNKMIFPGLPNAADRAAVIAYLQKAGAAK